MQAVGNEYQDNLMQCALSESGIQGACFTSDQESHEYKLLIDRFNIVELK